MSHSVTISIAAGDSYITTEKAEVKIDIPDGEVAAIVYAQLRNDLRRLEDGVRERVTTMMMPPSPTPLPTPPAPLVAVARSESEIE